MDFDFGASTVVEKIDLVPEQFRSLYVEKEGKHVLKSDDPSVKGAVEAILALNKALKAERVPRMDFTLLKDFGSTPEEIRAKFDELQEQLRTNAKIDPKKIKEEMAGQFKKDLDTKEARIAALRASLDTHLIDSALKSAIIAEKGDVELLLPFARALMRPMEVDGRYEVTVVDEKGNARFSGVTGQAMTSAELIKEMKQNPKYWKLFDSITPSGAGTRPGASSGKGTRSERDLSPVEKISAGLRARANAR